MVVQRVSASSVSVDGTVRGEIGRGLMLLVGFGLSDGAEILKPMAEKILNMRIFSNDQGRFDLSVLDLSGEILAIPQFTLYADTSKGRRPDFFGALPPAEASAFFERFVACLAELNGGRVHQGVFGASMSVSLTNEGPVTIILDSTATNKN